MRFPHLLAIFLVIFSPHFLRGQTSGPKFDAEPNGLYRWQIGIRCSSHPVLSSEVRQQLARELKASLQSGIAAIGDVEIVDFTNLVEDKNPLFKNFAEKGWAALDPDLTRELTNTKTHILTIDYQDGQFTLAARQLDGYTGIASPVLRKQTTRSVDMLSRHAALLIEPDFGPVGIAEPISGDSEAVKVTFRGHAVASPSKWVKPGDVLAVSVIRELAVEQKNVRDFKGSLPMIRTGVPYHYTLLKAVEGIQKDGSCRCLILTRYKDPFAYDVLGRPAQKRIGLRVMKLATVATKIRLRLVGQDGQPHLRGSLLQLAGTDLDFSAQTGPDDLFRYEAGIYRSGRIFNNIACVQVSVEGGRTELFPVPVLGDEPVVLKFELKAEDEERAMMTRKCIDFRTRVADLYREQEALFKKMSSLLDRGLNRQAKTEADSGQKKIAEGHRVLTDELKLLRELPRASEEIIKRVLEESERRLGAIAKGQETFDKTKADLEEAAKNSADPEKLAVEFRAQELAERITQQVARGDIPEALESYEKLINLRPEQDIKDKREKLLAEWSPKDEEHRKGRETVKRWTTLRTFDEIRDGLPELKKAVDVHIKKADKLGLRRIQNIFEPTYAILGKMVQDTDNTTEEGAKTVKAIDELLDGVRKTDDKTREALKMLLEKK